MPSLSPKNRVSLCLFSFTDGRRCRTPRSARHPHFCFYHAQKEAQARAAESLAKDLACFFSGDYLSACDLSTAMARLIPAVVRGDIKPRLARTVVYMMQGLIQTVHLAKDEYINAFGTEGWRKAIRTSVNANYDHRFPTAPEPEPQQPAAAPVQSVVPGACHPERSEGPCLDPAPSTTSETRLVSAPDQITQPINPTPPPLPRPQSRPQAPNREPYAIHFDHNYRLRSDGKPF